MRFTWIAISILGLLAGCSNPDIKRHSVTVLGHGGAGFITTNNHHPSNSRESILRALLIQGADGVEVDVQMTKDQQLVLYHDNRLESSTKGTGFVSDYSLAEVQKIQYRAVATNLTKTSTIWSLQELIRFVDSMELDVVLSLNIQEQREMAGANSAKVYDRVLEKLLMDYSNTQNVIVEKRDSTFLNQLPVIHNMGVKLFYTGALNLRMMPSLKTLDGVVSHYLDVENQDIIDLLQAQGKEVSLYGLKIRQDVYQALKMHPDMVQTDNIPLTKSFLE